ncbi:uncharacterized protein L201_000734 [Kwoniella dendrophila CBS 6074]|uniref:peptidylprolyl isomerase n=1 Tax=Kwoniella dendrophila CBS 6074 TaxID=1295534 RepID=A0AAX4JKD3_9TREE
MPNPRTFFDFSVGDQPLGRVVFELFSDVVPKTVENFRALCTGEKGISPISNIPLHYKGCPIHRVIDGFMIQGGDFTKRNGSGGESIYNGKPFDDEKLQGDGTEVDKKGLLVMANRGPNTNGSQFFITLAPSPHLTGKHVVFGKVIFGLEQIESIGKLSVDDRDRPLSPVIISHCGELELRKPQAKPQKARSPSISPIRSRSDSPDSGRRKKSKSRRNESDSDSASASEVDSDDSRERRRKSKKRKERKSNKKSSSRRDRSRSRERKKDKEKKLREETEEELDIRLEREEKERLEIQRLENLKVMKQKLEDERQKIKDSGGVVYKGRGSMRYLDPETTHRSSIPRNYDSRRPDSRPPPPRNGPPPRRLGDRISDNSNRDYRDRDRDLDRSGGRNNRGGEYNQRDRLDREMDKWQHDRSQVQSINQDRERAKFTRGDRDDILERDRSTLGRTSRGRSPITRNDNRSPRMKSQSPIRGRTRSRSRSIGARSDGSDMVMDLED